MPIAELFPYIGKGGIEFLGTKAAAHGVVVIEQGVEVCVLRESESAAVLTAADIFQTLLSIFIYPIQASVLGIGRIETTDIIAGIIAYREMPLVEMGAALHCCIKAIVKHLAGFIRHNEDAGVIPFIKPVEYL